MSLSQDGYDFEGKDTHGLITVEGSFEPRIAIGSFWGVAGESHLTGDCQGANLFCDYTLHNYDDRPAIKTAIDTIRSKALELTGTITQTISSDTLTFEQCTFLGFECEAPWNDGVTGKWCCRGRLRWRQRKRDTVEAA